MNGLPYYKAYPRDFIEGTIGMSFELKGAYRLVLDLIYMQGGELPDDARYISGLLGCSIRKWKSFREQLVELGKLQVSGEFLTNYRAVSELETLSKLQDNQREKRSRPNKNKGLQSPQNHQPEPEPEEVKEDTNVSSKKEPSAKPGKKGTRLSDDWQAPAEFIDWAVGQGLPTIAAHREAERFRDYWIGKSGSAAVKTNWLATWRNWVRKAVDDQSRRGRPYANQPAEREGTVHMGAFGRAKVVC